MGSSFGSAAAMTFDNDNITEYGYLTLSTHQTAITTFASGSQEGTDTRMRFDQIEGNIELKT